MTTPRRLFDPLTGAGWLIDRFTSLIVGTVGNSGAGQGEMRRFRQDALLPRALSAAYTLTPFDDGARFVCSATPTITIPSGLHGAFRFEAISAVTFSAGAGVSQLIDGRIVSASTVPWAEVVVTAVDSTGTATGFHVRGTKLS